MGGLTINCAGGGVAGLEGKPRRACFRGVQQQLDADRDVRQFRPRVRRLDLGRLHHLKPGVVLDDLGDDDRRGIQLDRLSQMKTAVYPVDAIQRRFLEQECARMLQYVEVGLLMGCGVARIGERPALGVIGSRWAGERHVGEPRIAISSRSAPHPEVASNHPRTEVLT